MDKSDETFGKKYWVNLENLSEIDKRQFPVFDLPVLPKEEIIARIEDAVVQLVHQVSTGSAPALKIRSRKSWSNCEYVPNVGVKLKEDTPVTIVSLENEVSVKKFGMLMKILGMVYKLLQSGKTATKRDLYYEQKQLFQTQAILDQHIDDIACMLDVPRRMLNVVATSKGCVVGDLEFQDADGKIIRCGRDATYYMGVMIPSHVDKIQHLRSKAARFVLVVEKDATYRHLLESAKSMPYIMITAKGNPDVNTRLLIRKIWNALKIPVFGLMDADPYGIDIFCVYKFGSLSHSFDSSSLVLPFMHWLGVFPSDIRRLSISDDAVFPLGPRDKSRCRDLLSRPYMQHFPRLAEEIRRMYQTDCKADIQALNRISPWYLSEVFIPSKIKHGEWI